MDKTYWKAINALYGDGEPPTHQEVKIALVKKKDSVGGSEADEQTKLVAWLRKRNILVAHFANGGKRNKFEAYRLKQLGVSPGIPDLVIPVARKNFHGCFIEMKRLKGGVVSAAQAWWIDRLRKEGYRVEVCYGFEQAVKVIGEYLGG